MERSNGAAPLGAVAVAGGALKLFPPRLPNDPPEPARAKASAEKPIASIAVKINIKVLWRNAMAQSPAVDGASAARGPYMGRNQEKRKASRR